MKQLIVEKCIKRFTNLILLVLWAIAPITAMDKPLPEQKQNNSQSSSLVVKKEFGESFDFASILKDDSIKENSTYKQRLTNVKRYLFDFIPGVERPLGKSIEQSGSITTFFKNYNDTVLQLKESANLLPMLNGEIVTRNRPNRTISLGNIFQNKDLNFCYILGHPYFVITDPDTESLALNLIHIRNSTEHSFEDKKNIVVKLSNTPNQSSEYKAVIHGFIFDFNSHYLDKTIEAKKEKKIETPDAAHRKSFSHFILNCPYLVRLQILQTKLLQCPRNFLDLKDGKIVFTEDTQKLFSELNCVAQQIDTISQEYAVIYNRIQQELKACKKQNAVRPISVESQKIEDVNITIPQGEKNVTRKIRYAERVLKWFRNSYTKAQQKSRILYHALLPLMADGIVMSYGQKKVYHNKTHIGQKDDHYSIAGKIIDEGTHEESYCVFRLCIDPKGVCYHRECSTYEWENLEPELQKTCAVEEEAYTVDDEQVLETDKATIIRDTPLTTTLINPRFAHKIILFKKQF